MKKRTAENSLKLTRATTGKAAPRLVSAPDSESYFEAVESAFWRIDSAMDALHGLITAAGAHLGQRANGLTWAARALLEDAGRLIVAAEVYRASCPSSVQLERPAPGRGQRPTTAGKELAK